MANKKINISTIVATLAIQLGAWLLQKILHKSEIIILVASDKPEGTANEQSRPAHYPM